MDTGNKVILEEPGFHELCKECKNYQKCPEKAEFDIPIKIDMDKLRTSLIKNALENYKVTPTNADIEFLAEETKTDIDYVRSVIRNLL